MHRLIRRAAVVGIAAAVAVAMFTTPAHAANPFTPAQACNNDFGGSWYQVSDGHRYVKTSSGAIWGDVYLMYNGSTGYNCVATIKRVWVGTLSPTYAGILVQGWSNWKYDWAWYRYYAAVKAYARDTCVQYEGIMYDPWGTMVGAYGGRYTWGNCG